MALQVTSEISRHILKSPLIDLKNGDVSYVFNDFYHYFVPAMDAFDSFYKKYNLIVLKGNREYQNFPDDSSKEINFCNMEHAIGLSSFGFKKTDERLFLETMLNRVILSSTNNDRISPNDENGIIRIIDYWDNFKRLESTDYDFINRMLLKYKDVDNIYTQRIMFKLSKIILEKAFSNKAKLLIYRPSINERKEDMLDDLVYFIDNIDNDRIKKNSI